jgi:hypothetical protein
VRAIARAPHSLRAQGRHASASELGRQRRRMGAVPDAAQLKRGTAFSARDRHLQVSSSPTSPRYRREKRWGPSRSTGRRDYTPRTDCTAAVAAGHRPRTVGRSVRSMARGTASTCSAMGSALRSPLGQRAEARPERSTSVPTGIHLYVLLRASLHFPFFQYMYVPQLPAGLAFV